MNCNVCLEYSDEMITIREAEGIELKVAAVLTKYFQFCFDDAEPDGCVCRKCWWKIDSFYQFCAYIEELHKDRWLSLSAREKVFVATIADCEISKKTDTDDVKPVICIDTGTPYNNELFVEPVVKDDPTAAEPTSELVNIKFNRISNAKVKIKSLSARKSTCTTATYRPKSSKKNPIDLSSLQCDQCSERFMTQSRLYLHMKRVHSENQFKCTSCADTFSSQELLDQHVTQEHVKEQCPYCDKCMLRASLAFHIKNIHEQMFQIVCEICGKVSNRKEAHRIHYEYEHLHYQQNKFQCDICGKFLKNKNVVRQHMTSKHIQGPRTCPICGRISPNQKALIQHKMVHTAYQFKCIVCGRAFRDKTKLREHSYIHSGITDAYKCEFCGKTFRFGSSWSAHRKKVHGNEQNAAEDKR